jgi:hypothetical protein
MVLAMLSERANFKIEQFEASSTVLRTRNKVINFVATTEHAIFFFCGFGNEQLTLGEMIELLCFEGLAL